VTPNWEQARRAILARLEEVGRLVEVQDEGGALDLINRRDEFCEAADTRRSHGVASQQDEPSCYFCEGFVQSGGCVGMLARLNQAIMAGNWQEARQVNDDYIRWVQSLELHN
jgi:hypothetical protein